MTTLFCWPWQKCFVDEVCVASISFQPHVLFTLFVFLICFVYMDPQVQDRIFIFLYLIIPEVLLDLDIIEPMITESTCWKNPKVIFPPP